MTAGHLNGLVGSLADGGCGDTTRHRQRTPVTQISHSQGAAR